LEVSLDQVMDYRKLATEVKLGEPINLYSW